MVRLRKSRASSGRTLGVGREARPHHERRVELEPDVLIQAGEPGGRDADDREVDAVEPHGAAEDGWIGAELLRPEIVAEDHHRVASGTWSSSGRKSRPSSGATPTTAEEIAAHQHADARLRQRRRDRWRSRPWTWRTRSVRRSSCCDRGCRRSRDTTRAGSPGRGRQSDRQQLARTWHREGPEQQRIGKAEDRAVRADANRQRHHRDDREARIPREHPAAVAQVLREPLQPHIAHHGAALDGSTDPEVRPCAHPI